ncbi:hypothetical protein [Celeribacter sp. SCSIO 80788]|uniref:hypothetical protein n=1 Tax=Celeribacter sp. SCSIO 80788 TaxID=3117013 RepID=UPI003DA40E5C
MDMSLSPVDELARLRAKIAELRARESALVAGFISAHAPGRYHGLTCDVVVSHTAYQVFDISKLPPEMLDDDRYYATKQVTSIRIEDHEEDVLPTALHAPETMPLLARP